MNLLSPSQTNDFLSLSTSCQPWPYVYCLFWQTGKLYPRRLAFSQDHRSIYVTTNRFKSVKGFFRYALQTSREVTARTIEIGAIDHILRGQQTKRFALARVVALSNDGDEVMRLMLDSEIMSFSLVYRVPVEAISGSGIAMIDNTLAMRQGSSQRFETLDLILPNQQSYESLLRALENLVALHREEMKRFSRKILLMQLHWKDLGKTLADHLTATEWHVLCEKINIPLQRADQARVFKNYEKQLNEGEGMLFSYVGEILEDIESESRCDDPCDRLWNEVVATDPIPAVKVDRAQDDTSLELVNDDDDEETISAVAFLSFIRSQQRQFHASLEGVVQLVHTLNNQVSWEDLEESQRFDVTRDTRTASSDRLAKSRFVAFLMSDYNDLFDSSKGSNAADDMTKPLCHYWINTSHDTYLAKMPFGANQRSICTDVGALTGNGAFGLDAADEQMYLLALQRGVRCLDLDLWDGVSGEPVVSKCKPTGTEKTIPLAVILRTIRSFLRYNQSSYPIILRLENHCSLVGQQKVGQQIYNILGSANLLAAPNDDKLMNEPSPLPSPESLKGKVLIMGKRPAVIEEGAKVMNDDFDDENDDTSAIVNRDFTYDEEEEDDLNQQVIGFSSSGPITSSPEANIRKNQEQSLDVIVNEVIEASNIAKETAVNAESRAARLQFEAAEAEKLAAQLTQTACLTPAQVKTLASRPRGVRDSFGMEIQLGGEPAPHDEGLEVQEFLHDEVKESRDRYSSVIAEAIEASEIAISRLNKLNDADNALREAENNLYQTRQKEKELGEQARRAASEARSNCEHSESAKRRVHTVQELLRKCEESANSAKTVVVTASTEAKISERRASEAESRASRALASAERDRARADEDTKKEERLEQEVSEIHKERSAANNAAKLARDRVEKAAAMLEKVDEEIKSIEASDEFQKGCQRTSEISDSSIMAKHKAKIEELELCKDLIKEASTENSTAEAHRRSVNEMFEEKAQMWKIQADIASQVRKQADRSCMVAEELAEHAEEERDAATLRHVACEKAEANVQERKSHLESVRAQLSEAERAAADASKTAAESRNRADMLAKEAENATHYKAQIRVLENCKFIREQAATEYEVARIVKEEKDASAADTKRLLETNAEVYTSAVRDAAAESHRVNNERLCEKKAVIAFNRALLARKQADHAKALSKIALATSQEKLQTAKRAEEYRERKNKISAIPVSLAKLTWLHSTKHKFWEKSLNMPTFHVLSMAQQAVTALHEKDPSTTCKKMLAFTRLHLFRAFPSRKHVSNGEIKNLDPVLLWSLGCQLVSMNFHRPDEHLLVAEGRFRQNGACGYVLKPPHMIEKDLANQIPKEERWVIRILRGNYIPKPEHRYNSHARCISPFVKCVIYDANSANSSKVQQQHLTDVVKWNGFNPIWDEKDGFEFVVSRPDVAMVSITVWDMSDSGVEDFIGGASLPISHLRQGYRSVALFDSSNSRCGAFALASLLVNCQKMQWGQGSEVC